MPPAAAPPDPGWDRASPLEPPARLRPTPALGNGRIATRLAEPPFVLLAALLLGVFLVTRLPFFWYYPQVDLSQDSASYLDVANTMRMGRWPHFIFRTPGYPLLLWAVTSWVDRWLAVIYVQNLLSFLSALFLVHAVYRLHRALALPAAIAMCGFLGSSQVLFYDISLLSDSLYTSMVILVVASLLLAFASGRPGSFSLASALMAAAILVRPAGAYFAVIYVLIIGYLLWNRSARAAIVGFAAPFPAILLLFCAYNLATIGQFVISPFGEANIAGATALFWEPDPRLPEVANKALEALPASYAKQGITGADLALVRESWDTDALFDVYAKSYNRLVWGAGWGSGTRFGSGDYLTNRRYIRDVSLMAIRKHPALYAKYVWVNMVRFFDGIGYKFDIYASLNYRSRGQPPERETAPGGTAAEGPASGAPWLERGVKGLELRWQRFHGAIFQSILWTWAYFAMLLLSAAQLARHRGRHHGAFLLLVLTLIPIGAGLVVCLVEVALDRYSYATQWVCYLCVALSPLLLCARIQGASATAREARRSPAP